MNLFFLAAGLGTRFLPYTQFTPKPAIPFLNVPMGLYQFQYIPHLEVPISSFVINTHHLPKKIESLYSEQPYFKSVPPQFSFEPGQILGSAGAIKNAENLLTPNQPILLMNADEVYFTDNLTFLNAMSAQHQQSNALATLAIIPHPKAGKKFGAIWCDGDSVRHIGKTCSDQTLKPWHYIGVCLLSWEMLSMIKPGIEQNILYDTLFNQLNRVQTFKLEADWFETGNNEDLLKTTEHVLTKLDSNDHLKRFINLYDTSDLILSSLISRSHHIDINRLSGFNCISKSAEIKSETVFENCIAFADQIIK